MGVHGKSGRRKDLLILFSNFSYLLFGVSLLGKTGSFTAEDEGPTTETFKSKWRSHDTKPRGVLTFIKCTLWEGWQNNIRAGMSNSVVVGPHASRARSLSITGER